MPGSGDTLTDNDTAGSVPGFLRHHERIVGAPDRIVIIAPQPASCRTHAPYLLDFVQVTDGDQITATGNRSLDDHFRRVLQNDGPFSFYGVGKKDDRGQHEYNERINEE